MRRLQQQFFTLGPPDWPKMKNSAAPAVKREAEKNGGSDDTMYALREFVVDGGLMSFGDDFPDLWYR